MSLTKHKEQLLEKFRELGKSPVQLVPATVQSVNEEDMTCDVELQDDTEIFDVRLKAGIDGFTDGLVQIPVVGSIVLVAMIGNTTGNRIAIAFSAVEKVIFYGGSNEGLTKINPLVGKLNALESKVNDLIGYINGHSHAGNGAPPTPTYNSGTLDQTQKSDLEDTKVLH